jgi:hypothetical protein
MHVHTRILFGGVCLTDICSKKGSTCPCQSSVPAWKQHYAGLLSAGPPICVACVHASLWSLQIFSPQHDSLEAHRVCQDFAVQSTGAPEARDELTIPHVHLWHLQQPQVDGYEGPRELSCFHTDAQLLLQAPGRRLNK